MADFGIEQAWLSGGLRDYIRSEAQLGQTTCNGVLLRMLTEYMARAAALQHPHRLPMQDPPPVCTASIILKKHGCLYCSQLDDAVPGIRMLCKSCINMTVKWLTKDGTNCSQALMI